MNTTLRAEVCVGAAIFREGRLLLLRRALNVSFLPGTWDIPGGHVEEGENLEGALRREILEETGFSVVIHRPIRVLVFEYQKRRGTSTPTVGVDYLCTTRSVGPPMLDRSEHSEFAWAKRRDMPRYPVPSILTGTIRAAFKAHPSR